MKWAKKIHLTKEELINLYWGNQLSPQDIAIQLGVSSSSVWKRLKQYGIPRRSPSEATKLMVKQGKSPHLSKGWQRGSANPRWKGGRIRVNGYVCVYQPDHPLAKKRSGNKGGSGYVLEHRLVVEKELGRYLLPTERVHHINGIRDDNRPENLEILSPTNHSLREIFCNSCSLKKEVRLLRWELKQMREALQLRLG